MSQPSAPTPTCPAPSPPRLVLNRALYLQHQRSVARSVALCDVPARDVADVVQEVFVQVHRSLARYNPSRPFEPWLKVITIRTARDWMRGPRGPARTQLREHPVDLVHARASPEEQVASAKLWDVLQAILQEMTEEQREVYQLHVLEEVSIPDVAIALDVPEGTVRSRLARAREVFDKALARLRASERYRDAAVLLLLTPAALVEAARAGSAAAGAMETLEWRRLARGLGLDAAGPLATLPARHVVAGALSLFVLGAAAGAALHAAFAGKAPGLEELARAEVPAFPAVSAPPAVAPDTVLVTSAPSATAAAGQQRPGAADGTMALREEQALLQRARTAFEGKRYEAALRELRLHEQLYPGGQLAGDRCGLVRLVEAARSALDAGSQ
jgi:RNA polymerase sigma-70 factor, ECF subfamily